MAQEFERKMKMIQSGHSESVSDEQKEKSAMAKTNAERNREYRARRKQMTDEHKAVSDTGSSEAESAPKKEKKERTKRARQTKDRDVPSLADLKAASAKVTASPKNRLINIEFSNGFSVGLLPVRVKASKVKEVRDLLIGWLNHSVKA